MCRLIAFSLLACVERTEGRVVDGGVVTHNGRTRASMRVRTGPGGTGVDVYQEILQGLWSEDRVQMKSDSRRTGRWG